MSRYTGNFNIVSMVTYFMSNKVSFTYILIKCTFIQIKYLDSEILLNYSAHLRMTGHEI